MNELIIKAVVNDIVKWLGRGLLFVAIIGILFGLYMCDHYRWGSCP